MDSEIIDTVGGNYHLDAIVGRIVLSYGRFLNNRDCHCIGLGSIAEPGAEFFRRRNIKSIGAERDLIFFPCHHIESGSNQPVVSVIIGKQTAIFGFTVNIFPTCEIFIGIDNSKVVERRLIIEILCPRQSHRCAGNS